MIQTNINTALAGNVGDAAYHVIYLYRDGDTVLYVGRSADPLQRLTEHLGLTGIASRLGDTITDNMPASLEWTLELYTLADCLPLVEQYRPGLALFYRELLNGEKSYIEQLTSRRTPLEARITPDHLWEADCRKMFHQRNYDRLAHDAEGSMIEHYNPCLNTMGRTRPNPLPARYQKCKTANTGVKLSSHQCQSLQSE
jgi:hypothetical protein